MKKFLLVLAAVLLIAAALVIAPAFRRVPPTSNSTDPIISVKSDDAEMNAAIAKARSLLPQFWQIFDKPEHGETDFSIKVEITENDQHEHFWVKDIERKDGKIFATIDNDPEVVHNVKLGQHIQVNEADISDWLYIRDGKMYGNYTLRVLFKHMDPKEAREAEQYKKMLADP